MNEWNMRERYEKSKKELEDHTSSFSLRLESSSFLLERGHSILFQYDNLIILSGSKNVLLRK